MSGMAVSPYHTVGRASHVWNGSLTEAAGNSKSSPEAGKAEMGCAAATPWSAANTRARAPVTTGCSVPCRSAILQPPPRLHPCRCQDLRRTPGNAVGSHKRAEAALRSINQVANALK